MIVAIPIGMFTKKIHSQPTVSTSRPPINGPASAATEATEPHRPIGAPRRAGGKRRVMTAIVCGVISAAPRPCTARAAISELMEPERPHHRLARVKTTSPARYMFLGP